MTAQQLKNSILQMAVQGKLVPQDPDDEPASVLLERIRAEKEQLIKQKKIKREKNPSYIFRGADNTPYEKIGNNDPVSIADEVPFEIPDTWEWVRFGNIAANYDSKRRPVTKDQRNTVHGYYDYYGATGAIDKVDEYIFEGEYLMIGEDGGNFFTERDNSFVATGRFWANNHVHIVQPIVCNIHYLKHYLDYCNLPRMGLINGIAVPKLNQEHMNSILVPLPPLSEQERITDEIQKYLPYIKEYETAEKELFRLNATFPNSLKKSILQMAVQGKLVPQNPTDEPASVLLERIRVEKQRLVKEGKIKKDKHESVIFRRDNSHYEKCGVEEICIDDIIPFDIPESWTWVRLITLIEEKPANGYSPKAVGYSTDVKNLTLTATTSGYFKFDAYKYVDIAIPSDSKYWLKHNDILVQRSNSRELVGTACIYPGEDNAFIYPDLMMRIRIMNGIDIRYIDYVLKSPFIRQYYTRSASGTSESMPKINQAIVSNTLIPLPPIAEQMRITKCIDKLLSRLTF